MRVYRYERPGTDHGPYQNSFDYGLAHMNTEHGDSDHPPPSGDFGWWLDDSESRWCWYFACTSYESLLKWFENWNERIIADGCVITIYTVDDKYVRYGNSGKQVAFQRHMATREATYTTLPVSC